jgi:protein CWC15
MTTAHRPTYKAAIGGSEQGGNKVLVPSRQYSAKDLPGQMKMKERVDAEDLRLHDYRNELIERERQYQNHRETQGGNSSSTQAMISNDRG